MQFMPANGFRVLHATQVETCRQGGKNGVSIDFRSASEQEIARAHETIPGREGIPISPEKAREYNVRSWLANLKVLKTNLDTDGRLVLCLSLVEDPAS